MEKILQNLVKIIIVGCLCEKTSVLCNRQFSPGPSLPYYHNDDYYTGVYPPYPEPYPVYYQEPNVPPPPPISYQNMNSFSPPQLFHQNENYHPPTPDYPNYPYSLYPGNLYRGNYYQPSYPPAYQSPQVSQKNSPEGLKEIKGYPSVQNQPSKEMGIYPLAQGSYNNPSESLQQMVKYPPAQPNYNKLAEPLQQMAKQQPAEVSYNNPSKVTKETPKYQSPQPNYPSKEPTNQNPQAQFQIFTTNVVHKEGPYYQDEEYSDNYSDDSTYSDPCGPNSPYSHFEASSSHPNNPPEIKYTLCSTYFQPNFGHPLTNLKTPITLLPSRFPPRVEELLERIQNYFSTYTQQGTQNGQNQTAPSSTTQPPISESETPSPLTAEDTIKRNKTVENENLEQTPETTTARHQGNDLEKIEIVTIEIERKESSTTQPDVLGKKELQVDGTTTEIPSEFPETPTTTKPQEELQKHVDASHHQFPPVETTLQEENTTESYESKEIGTSSPEADVEATDVSTSTESAELSQTEEYNDHPTSSEHPVTDTNG